jgi:hypothetical protein
MRRTREICPICGNILLWWRSRTGMRVCMVCHPDPLEALAMLLSGQGRGAIGPHGAHPTTRWGTAMDDAADQESAQAFALPRAGR